MVNERDKLIMFFILTTYLLFLRDCYIGPGTATGIVEIFEKEA